MKITIIGTGYVGLVTGACLAEVGNDVLCFDIDRLKIARLQAGEIPIYEPGLAEMVARNRAASRLRFSDNLSDSVAHGKIQFIAVGTPPRADGHADLQYVLRAAEHIGREMQEYKLVVTKSTVPVGTADQVKRQLQQALEQRGSSLTFSVASNPEFLKEGAAIEDFMRPDRVIIGTEDSKATELLRILYQPFQRNHDRIQVMDIRSAELTKYAANAMLATRISFMNELANLAERVGADIELVRRGIGADPRIGYHFLYPGIGYGGSCFPKDIKSLQKTAQDYHEDFKILQAVEEVNQKQKLRLVEKITQRFGQDLSGYRIAVWGLAFKPNTDDMREAPSVEVIQALCRQGAEIVAYDPVAMLEAQKVFGVREKMTYVEAPLDAVQKADALIIVTEWKEFRSPDFEALRQRLTRPIIFDGRNLYEPTLMQELGFEYYPIGRRNTALAHR